MLEVAEGLLLRAILNVVYVALARLRAPILRIMLPSVSSISNLDDWQKMVLRAMPRPAWLQGDATDNDVVISSRVRIARNLAQHRYPHHADSDELRSILQEISEGAAAIGLEQHRGFTESERDFLLGCRMISPEFEPGKPGCGLFWDRSKSVSMMVNEEDHMRIQALTGGWSLSQCSKLAHRTLTGLGSHLTFAHAEPWGHLTASPYNAGRAERNSVLFHLVGLAQSRRLPKVLSALSASRIIVRGVYGESSRAVGAFFQISTTDGNLPAFRGACDYLIAYEREARAKIDPDELSKLVRQAIEFAVRSRELGLADSFRVMAYVRWAISQGLPNIGVDLRECDYMISTIEVHGRQDPVRSGQHRAHVLRSRFEKVL